MKRIGAIAVIAAAFLLWYSKARAVSVTVANETISKVTISEQSKCWDLAAGDSFVSTGTVSGTQSSFSFVVPTGAKIRACIVLTEIKS